MGTPIATVGGGVVELPLGNAAATFDLEKAVCSHGLFMMAPNLWDSQSKTLTRPLRLDPGEDCGNGGSVLVRISQPSRSLLHVGVLDADSLSSQHQQSLLAQVRRMLRLSEVEEEIVKEFHEMHGEAKERGFGRVFRSPTLFEDMVKCILLCNCRWSRTLSMARALCELQLELQCPQFGVSFDKVEDGVNSRNPTAVTENFAPKTPAGRESKMEIGAERHPSNLLTRFRNTRAQMEAENEINMRSVEMLDCSQETVKLCPSSAEDDLNHCCNTHQTSAEICKADSNEIDKHNLSLLSDLQSSEGIDSPSYTRIGNFPTPKELASVDEKCLARRCNLGYRASRILKLAQSIVEGRVQLRQLEEACGETSLLNYNKLDEQLKQIDGFGPFTCANVLVCMGFYHVIPVDSETIRHLKQVHARNSTPQKVQGDIDEIYGKYNPFQFLAYWSEVWHFYEEWFGKLSEMPHANYKLITAANMKPRTPKAKEKRNKMRQGSTAQTKRTKVSQ